MTTMRAILTGLSSTGTQRLISDNANGKSFMSRGSIRRGEALVAGLLRCGHCGRKLHIAYSGENGSSGRYHCRAH